MPVHVIRLHDEWVDIEKQWSTFEVHIFGSPWSSLTVGDHENRQHGPSNMTLKTSMSNNDDAVKTTMRTCQAEDVDNAEVVAVVVVAAVVMVPMVEETGARQAMVGETMGTMTVKALENRRRCSNHAALGNTR